MFSFAVAAWSLTAILAIIGLVTAPFERRVHRSDPGTRRKLFAYGAIIVLEWTLAAAAIRIYGWAALFHSDVATAHWLPVHAVVGPALGAATAAYVILALLPLLQSLRGPRLRKAYAAAYRRGSSAFPGMLPNTAIERAAFILFSLTAGFCEEVLYRGFLIRFLHESALALPIAGALAVSTLFFGLGHIYLGAKGFLSALVYGLSMGILFLLSGSLIPVVVLHILIDAQVAYVLRPISGPDAAAASGAA
jgi:membrane protease YdiL (CAAX protease family)